MAGLASINIQRWIDEHRELLKPPVGNKCVYELAQDFIVMVVGGPNARKDFHVNEGEEFFFQLEGDIVLRTIQEGVRVDIPIRQGEIFLLPPKIPHSPQRPAGSVGIVIERMRRPGERDGCVWFCDSCQEKLYDEYFVLEKPRDIVEKLKGVMRKFSESAELRTCRHCGAQAPA